MNDEIAELNRIRLDEDLTLAQLAQGVGVDASTLHRLLFRPNRKVFDRTLHKVRGYLERRAAAAAAAASKKKRRVRPAA